MFKHYDLESVNETSVNYRWLQPPQIAYFVSTVDEYGNANLTPVTLGTLVCAVYPKDGKPGSYFFTFSLGCAPVEDTDNAINPRQGFLNLQKNGECVISYIGNDLMRQSIICNMPIPYGISEFDVAGLTAVDSQKVQAKSIQECAVNMEARVVQSYNLDGHYQHYICKVVAVFVRKDYIARDAANGNRGVYAIDPLFEVQINSDPSTGNEQGRLYYGRLDPDKIHRTPDDFGCLKDWVGSYQTWIDSEMQRGKISAQEAAQLLALEKDWRADRDPKTNAAVKDELSRKLSALCQLPQE